MIGFKSLGSVKNIWGVVEKVVEEAIYAAEHFMDLDTGASKKTFVVETVLDFMQTWEDKHDILPGALEGMVFQGIRFALSWMIERVFQRLNSEGLVNVPA